MAVLSGAQLSGEPTRTLAPAPISSRFLCPRPLLLKQQQQQQQILLKIGKKLITLLSHPQIAYKLIEAFTLFSLEMVSCAACSCDIFTIFSAISAMVTNSILAAISHACSMFDVVECL